jgi:hypothetical protein
VEQDLRQGPLDPRSRPSGPARRLRAVAAERRLDERARRIGVGEKQQPTTPVSGVHRPTHPERVRPHQFDGASRL